MMERMLDLPEPDLPMRRTFFFAGLGLGPGGLVVWVEEVGEETVGGLVGAMIDRCGYARLSRKGSAGGGRTAR